MLHWEKGKWLRKVQEEEKDPHIHSLEAGAGLEAGFFDRLDLVNDKLIAFWLTGRRRVT